MSAVRPVQTTWTTGSTEGIMTGTWRAALPRHIVAPSPCHVACPVGGEIADWIGRARAGDFRGAWDVLTRHNPFPAIAGRVCHHPCETACNRSAHDEPLAICKLERFVGDLALAAGWAFTPASVARDARVAVIGGGPSGLSVAYHLRRRGYGVTLFETRDALGGLLRYGIPGYRLPRPVLDAEISRVVALGIEVRLNARLDSPAMLEGLRAEYDAVYVAIGAGIPKRLPQFDYAQPWIVDGADYLAQVNTGVTPSLGRRIVVIGGGSAALDVARSARRSGHDVTIVALEDVAQMPAQRAEVDEALEEGIRLCDGAMATAASARGASGIELQCQRVRFESSARRGQFTVTPIAGSEFVLSADALISAVGQDPDLAPLRTTFAGDDRLVQVDANQATSAARVYAGGDVASMARFVTEAIGMGGRAALEIDRALESALCGLVVPAHSDTLPPEIEPVVGFASINTFYFAKQARAAERRLDAGARQRGDAEVQLPFEHDEALAEAGRCFSCGTCIHCDNCVVYCPDLAVARVAGTGGMPDEYRVLTEYCKGCGMCVRECPTGSMKMQDEMR